MNLFKPIFFFHSKEKYFPISKEHLSSHSTDLSRINIENPEFFEIDDNKRELYCYESEKFVLYGKEYFFITYYLIFAYQNSFLFGHHFFDIEYVTIQFENNVPLRYYLSSHGHGNWFFDNEMEYIEKRPVIYCARYSHAFYNKAKVYRRFFGFGNDTTERGIVMNDLVLVNITEKEKDSIFMYKGDITFRNKFSQKFPYYNRRNPFYYKSQYKFQGGISSILQKIPSNVKNLLNLFIFCVLLYQMVKFQNYLLVILSVLQGFLITFVYLS
jgi:hypothetical protein